MQISSLSVELVSDVSSRKTYIQESLALYGCSVESKFEHWMHLSAKGKQNYFLDFGNHKGLLLRQHQRSRNWYMIGYPLGPRDEWSSLLLQALDILFGQQQAKKIYIEVEPEFRQELIRNLESTPYKDSRINTELEWPVFEMAKWDQSLSGGEWKKMRNIVNQFSNCANVEVKDCRSLPQEQLLAVVRQWIKYRNAKDSVDSYYYENVVRSNFEGMDVCRSVVVDGIPHTITAGWVAPDKKTYYSAIGIYDYLLPNLGEFANIDDLRNLKQQGYALVDFGGSDQKLLDFKKKFKFHMTYKTQLFSIVRR